MAQAKRGAAGSVGGAGEMVHIKGGVFEMGSKDPRFAAEDPAHRVRLDGFYIDRTEVTVAAYRRCVAERACDEPEHATNPDRNWIASDREDHPMNAVSWFGARQFCRWRDARLPSEAEWELAARGRDGRTYPWGNELPTDRLLRWSGACGSVMCAGSTAPVGSHPAGASPYGLQDMAGNVREWVHDWYAPYGRAPQRNPRGPKTGEHRVHRGGGWTHQSPLSVAAVARGYAEPDATWPVLGFRCARDATRGRSSH
jgi:formylglycine-generating enzyme required for sulfatase activity